MKQIKGELLMPQQKECIARLCLILLWSVCVKAESLDHMTHTCSVPSGSYIPDQTPTLNMIQFHYCIFLFPHEVPSNLLFKDS